VLRGVINSLSVDLIGVEGTLWTICSGERDDSVVSVETHSGHAEPYVGWNPLSRHENHNRKLASLLHTRVGLMKSPTAEEEEEESKKVVKIKCLRYKKKIGNKFKGDLLSGKKCKFSKKRVWFLYPRAGLMKSLKTEEEEEVSKQVKVKCKLIGNKFKGDLLSEKCKLSKKRALLLHTRAGLMKSLKAEEEEEESKQVKVKCNLIGNKFMGDLLSGKKCKFSKKCTQLSHALVGIMKRSTKEEEEESKQSPKKYCNLRYKKKIGN